MVSEAQRSRAPIQQLADRVAGLFVPAVVLCAVVTFAAWAFWGPQPPMAYAIINAVAVLIIACPCALGLATPMSVMAATGKGAGHGLLFRNAEAIEHLRAVDVLLLDKTGTLTVGKPVLTDIRVVGGLEAGEVLALAAAVERLSEHPLAAAIVAGAEARGLPRYPARDFASVTGAGVTGQVENRSLALGNEELMAARGVDTGPLADAAELLRRTWRDVASRCPGTQYSDRRLVRSQGDRAARRRAEN